MEIQSKLAVLKNSDVLGTEDGFSVSKASRVGKYRELSLVPGEPISRSPRRISVTSYHEISFRVSS